MALNDLVESYEFILKLLELKNNNPKLKKYIDENYKLNHSEIKDFQLWHKNTFNEDTIKMCRDIQEISSNIFQDDYDKELRECMAKLRDVDNYRMEIKA